MQIMKKKKMTFGRFSAFARGKIVAFRQSGVPFHKISKKVAKKDGARPSLRAVKAVAAKAEADPEWEGEDSMKVHDKSSPPTRLHEGARQDGPSGSA